MKILFLADFNSAHTIKWTKSLANKGFEIVIAGFAKPNHGLYDDFDKITVVGLGVTDKTITEGKFIGKIGYLKLLPKIKEIIVSFKPDILHAHYASSYGLLGALSKFHPFVLSVWGYDVYDFPKKSPIHKQIIKSNLKRADKILSTSNVMAKVTKQYTDKPIEVTPFGIDLEIFKPMEVDSLFDKNDIVIGTVKTLKEKYGIEYLIKAFKVVSDKYPHLPLKLLIVGGGSLKNKLIELARDLNILDKTIFTGLVPYSEIPRYHNMLTVSVSVSVHDSESFGVAIIEASACEKPVVVSNVGGLPEVVEENVTGIIVPPQDHDETAKAIEKLILDKKFAVEMGRNGRKRVKKHFNWDDNVNQMISIYHSIFK